MPNPTRFTPLEAQSLYPADAQAILQGMLDRCYMASDRTLNDFSAASPIVALYEGHLFAILELLYYANRLPEALAVQFLKLAGIQRRLGKVATVNLTFTLTAPLGNPFYLSAGYMVSDVSNTYNFYTASDLIIPPGAISGEVTATAQEMGSAYNLAAYTITNLSETRAFLKSVVNLDAATGGLDEETFDEARSRGFVTLRRRGLISADDYEQEAMAILGAGSVAKAIGLLAADKITYEKGAVHIFCLNPDGTEPGDGQLLELRNALKTKAPIGIGVYTSAIDLVNLEVYIVAALLPGSNPETVASEIYASLDEYLTPGYLPLGETVKLKELEFVVRSAGVAYVQSVSTHNTLEVSYTDIPLPYSYSAAKLYDLTCDLVLDGQTFTYEFGQGGDKD
jgi:uncharacterized phage protein gp47/JayE